jgi:hypothetical protein
MTKYIFSIIILSLISNISFTQINYNCDEIRSYKFPEKFDDKSIAELQAKILELSNCGYDTTEIELLQNNSFMGSLVNEAVDKMLKAKSIQDFNLEMILKEFEIIRSDEIYQSNKKDILQYHVNNQNSMDRQRNQTMSDVYPTSRTDFDPNQIRDKNSNSKSILYFTHEDCKNCQSFENVVLKNESIAELINEHFDFYILQTDYFEKNPKAAEKINYDIQVNMFEMNSLPLLGILNENGKVIGKIPYRLDANNIYTEIQNTSDNNR